MTRDEIRTYFGFAGEDRSISPAIEEVLAPFPVPTTDAEHLAVFRAFLRAGRPRILAEEGEDRAEAAGTP